MTDWRLADSAVLSFSTAAAVVPVLDGGAFRAESGSPENC
jgi:hypothetical protein